MRTAVTTAAAALILMSGWLPPATADEAAAYQEMSSRYEAIRLALVSDSLKGIAENAQAIAERAGHLAGDFEPTAAGVPEAKASEGAELMPSLASAASSLATAADLDQAREAFFELSKPMGRYRKLVGTAGTSVVYCSMAKKAWIQPEGDIGNPYLGQDMPTCGEVIPD